MPLYIAKTSRCDAYAHVPREPRERYASLQLYNICAYAFTKWYLWSWSFRQLLLIGRLSWSVLWGTASDHAACDVMSVDCAHSCVCRKNVQTVRVWYIPTQVEILILSWKISTEYSDFSRHIKEGHFRVGQSYTKHETLLALRYLNVVRNQSQVQLEPQNSCCVWSMSAAMWQHHNY